uniref:Uncharacterized protein n=1 Tax=Timema cristinae TaxID=61476 RepID=A0A7R9H363_TIMCR|nr:unnamed protein product [Timema cristinae]
MKCYWFVRVVVVGIKAVTIHSLSECSCVKLAREHAEKVLQCELKQQRLLKERQATFQQAFNQDLHEFKQTGFLPGSDNQRSVGRGPSLEEVTLDPGDLAELDNFLNESSDGQISYLLCIMNCRVVWTPLDLDVDLYIRVRLGRRYEAGRIRHSDFPKVASRHTENIYIISSTAGALEVHFPPYRRDWNHVAHTELNVKL